jgi:multidrug resistance efflux pump
MKEFIMKRSKFVLLTLILLIPLVLTACSPKEESNITASGTLSAIEVPICPEVSGRVVEVFVSEGDVVQAGDVLFQIDDEIPQAQYDQTKAAKNAAEATLEAAKAQLLSAQLQRDLTSQNVRTQTAQLEQSIWTETVPQDYLPGWYFQKSESIAAAQAEIAAAKTDLENEKAKLDQEQKSIDNQDFIEVEARLAEAQISYTNAKTTLDEAQLSRDDDIKDAAQNNYDSAKSEFESAKLAYERKLNTQEAKTILEARARVAVAQSRYDNAIDLLTSLQTGDDSNQVLAAIAGVESAQAAVNQAQANLDQATAALNLISLQLDRTKVKAPISGTTLMRNVEAGELVAAGSTVMIVSQLDTLDLTVYVPEDQYGNIMVKQNVEIKVDSFPSDVFIGQVTRIASQVEFTPRNVQTSDSRTSTVYAIKITVPNKENKLKPGMPADVTFMPASK